MIEAWGRLCAAIVEQAEADIKKYQKSIAKRNQMQKNADWYEKEEVKQRIKKEEHWAINASVFLQSEFCDLMREYAYWSYNLRNNQVKAKLFSHNLN